MTTNTREQILASVDSMNDVIQESSLDVMFSMAESLDKAAVILENYNGSNIDSFAIFQEADAAVAEGKPEGEVNAEAKKESVFYKILMFIPRLLQKLGKFIANTWNNVNMDVKEVAGGVSEKTASIFDKILGKDENWIKEHAVELGLSGAALTAVLGIAAFFTRNKIGELFTSFINSAKALSVTMSVTPVFAWENGSFKTNLKFEGLKKTITDYVTAAKKINELAKTLVTTENMSTADAKAKIKEAKSSLNLDNSPICGAEYYYYNITKPEDGSKLIGEVAGVVDALKTAGVEGSDKFDKAIKPNTELEKDPEANKDVKELNQKNTVISKFLASTSNLFHGIYDWVTGIFKKGKEVDNANGANANAEEKPAEQAAETPESTEKQTEAEAAPQNNTEPGELTAEEEDAMINNIGVNESSKTEVEDDEAVVSESVSHWYSR